MKARMTMSTTLLVAIMAGAATIGAATANQEANTRTQTQQNARVARGEYIVSTAGCHDCHTPFHMTPNGPAPDMSRALSGHPENLKMPAAPKLDGPWVWAGAGTNTAFAGPWGVSYAFNLTPDQVTGLGIWTEEMFIKAMRTGRHMGVSRPILPPMPWPNVGRMTDEDLKSVYAYLRSIKPIKNQVPDAIINPMPPQVAAKR